MREILVLKTATIGADILRRQPDGGWPQDPDHIAEGDLTLASIGLRLPLTDIYAGTRLGPSRNP